MRLLLALLGVVLMAYACRNTTVEVSINKGMPVADLPNFFDPIPQDTVIVTPEPTPGPVCNQPCSGLPKEF
jgi:hypothetical protein